MSTIRSPSMTWRRFGMGQRPSRRPDLPDTRPRRVGQFAYGGHHALLRNCGRMTSLSLPAASTNPQQLTSSGFR
jgi:hypothetical protein